MATPNLPYRDRRQAGVALAEALKTVCADRENLLVLALPRGGVPVAYEVAWACKAQLDLMIVRKLGVPGQEELAMGAIASNGARVINDDVVNSLRIRPEVIEQVARREQAELERRQLEYRGSRPLPTIQGRWVILVDDGVATGASMRVAVAAVRQEDPERVIVAVPVAPPDTVEVLRSEADKVICPATPVSFWGVGQWYLDFSQTTDSEIRELLDRAWRREKTDAA